MAKTNKYLNIASDQVITYAIGAGVAYFLIARPLLIKLGIIKSAEQVAQEKSQIFNVENYVNDAISRQSVTKSLGEWQIIANNIYNDLKFSGVSDNKSDAGYQIARVQNDADFAALYKTFGKRKEYFFGIPVGGDQDLVQFITGNLDRSDLNIINDNYSRKGIKFRF